MKLDIQLFAASGSISCSQIGDYNVANNTTTERITFTVRRTSGSTYWGDPKTVNFTVNGAKYTSSLALKSSQTSSSCYVDVTVPHDADGSKYIEFNASIVTNTSAGTITASGSKHLTQVPRASAISLSSYNATVEESVTINISKKVDTFTHNLSYQPPNSTNWFSIATSVGSSYSWSITASLLSYFTNTSSGTFIIKCDTYNENNFVGSSQASLTVSPRANIDCPTYNLSISEGNATVSNLGIGSYVQNKSKIKVTISNIVKCQGSPLDSVYVSITESGSNNIIWSKSVSINANATSTTFYTDTLTKAGNYELSTVVYDKRHAGIKKSESYNSVAYYLPQIINVSAVRSTSAGVENDSGTYLKYTFVAKITSLNNKNARKFEVGYKKSTETNYSYKTISTSTYNLNNAGLLLAGVTLSANYVYDIRFRVTDSFGETIIDRELGTDFKLINFNASGKSMAFGTISNRSSNETVLDCNLTVNCMNGLQINEQDISTIIENKIKTLTQKNIIVAYWNEQQTISAETIILPFTEARTIGTKLTLSNGKIVIGANVSKVKISASIFLQDVESTKVSYIWGRILKNGSMTITGIVCGPTYFNSLSITEGILDVAQGDTIQIEFNKSSIDNHYPTIRDGENNSRVYVEVIE